MEVQQDKERQSKEEKSKEEQSNKGQSLVTSLLKSASSKQTSFQIIWLAVRLLAGGLMIHNGVDKLADVAGFADGVVSFIGLPYPVFFTYCAAYIEIIGAGLLVLGLLTRLSAAALLATMGVAVFFHLKANGLAITPLETAALYAGLYAFFLVNGGGRWSVDEFVAKRNNLLWLYVDFWEDLSKKRSNPLL